VAAPSRILRAPGERVKTDRRDTLKLARLLRLAELVAVRVPSVMEESARNLVRAREDARGDLLRARHRLSKLLLRQGLVWEAGAWTQAHGRSIGAYLGLMPGESPSGERRRQGAITKAGNGHARRLLVEAAWHQRRPFSRPSRELARRREGQPALVRVRRGSGPASAAPLAQLRCARRALHGGRRGVPPTRQTLQTRQRDSGTPA
jgi:transposase